MQLVFICLVFVFSLVLILFIFIHPDSPLGSGCLVGSVALLSFLSTIFLKEDSNTKANFYGNYTVDNVAQKEIDSVNVSDEQFRLSASKNLLEAEIEISNLKEKNRELNQLNQQLSKQELSNIDSEKII